METTHTPLPTQHEARMAKYKKMQTALDYHDRLVEALREFYVDMSGFKPEIQNMAIMERADALLKELGQ